ncbi:SDR family oxidoreductase [Methylovirgula sp. HY1]|uniref:SDR family oxidoreductase n=1 Tax=Methylovirgula sp. HY1 TaxID=2822761 RepID=UPI001C5AB895|nr:SDR family oxidoreductase [Methylovirgula sp. HY1]
MTMSAKFALVTGAGSGIGRAAALALMRAGWTLALMGRRRALLEETAALGAPANSLCLACDVGDPLQVAAAFEAIKTAFGRLDLLFNNAGMAARSVPMEELAYEEWKAVVDVNLTGTFLCTQQAVKLMKAQKPRGGRIINNGSVATQAPRPHSAPYAATKHAITGLTLSTSLDGRAYDIACGQIDIGNAATELLQPLLDSGRGVKVDAEPMIDVGLVGSAIVQMAELPLDANILFMTLMATKMPLIGRG